jgi:hypothetical protein
VAATILEFSLTRQDFFAAALPPLLPAFFF